MDLGFVVEASASVEKHGKGNFKRLLDFVEWTVRKFSISSTKTRVGLVTFGAKTDLVFNFERLVFRKNWFTVYLCFMFNICVVRCQFYLPLFGPLWRRHGCFILNFNLYGSPSKVSRLPHKKRHSSRISFPVVFMLWFNFYFPLFLCIVMYDNEYKTEESKSEPRIKLNHNIYTRGLVTESYSPEQLQNASST